MQYVILLRLGVLTLVLCLFACESESDDPNSVLSGQTNALDSMVVAVGKDNAMILTNLREPGGGLFYICGTGFKSNETLTLHSTSYGEELNAPVPVNQKGNFMMTYAPAVIGKTSGEAHILFVRENEVLELTIPWQRAE